MFTKGSVVYKVKKIRKTNKQPPPKKKKNYIYINNKNVPYIIRDIIYS